MLEKEQTKNEHVSFNSISINLDMHGKEGSAVIRYPTYTEIDGMKVRVPMKMLEVIGEMFRSIPNMDFKYSYDEDKDEYVVHITGDPYMMLEGITVFLMENTQVGNTPIGVLLNAGTLSDMLKRMLFEIVFKDVEGNGGEYDGDIAYR